MRSPQTPAEETRGCVSVKSNIRDSRFSSEGSLCAPSAVKCCFIPTMPTASHTNVLQYLQELAKDAGLTVSESGHGTDFTGAPTARLRVSAGSGKDHSLEITEAFASVLEKKPELQQELKSYLEILA